MHRRNHLSRKRGGFFVALVARFLEIYGREWTGRIQSKVCTKNSGLAACFSGTRSLFRLFTSLHRAVNYTQKGVVPMVARCGQGSLVGKKAALCTPSWNCRCLLTDITNGPWQFK